MAPDISGLLGLTFIDPATKEEFGTVRRLESGAPSLLARRGFEAFALDDCGNYFGLMQAGRVYFWDHETDQYIPLAKTFEQFSKLCTNVPPPTKEEAEAKVKSVWVNPEFASKMGISVGPDGWLKKPRPRSKK